MNRTVKFVDDGEPVEVTWYLGTIKYVVISNDDHYIELSIEGVKTLIGNLEDALKEIEQ